MTKTVALLLVISLLVPGCFTMIGAGAGSGHAQSTNAELARRRARGEPIPKSADEDPGQAAALGGMLGLVLDVAVVALVVHSIAQSVNNSSGPAWNE